MAKDREERRLQRKQAKEQKNNQPYNLQDEIRKADKRAGILDAMDARGVVPVVTSNQIPQSGVNLVKAIDEGGGGFNELQQAAKDAQKANTDEMSIQNDISTTANKLNTEIDQSQSQQIDRLPINKPLMLQTYADQSRDILPGDGSTISNIVSTGEYTRPSAEQYYNTEKIKMDIQRKAMDAYGNIPDVVMEKLQVDDYYPNIRKDIAVGNWSGRYLGSQTIYAPAGMRLPLGLYDARKRALKEAAKERQASLDKIMTIPETAEAYQSQFSESFLSGLNDLMGKNGWNPNTALRDPDTRAYIARYEAKAKEIIKTTTYADAVLTAYKDENQYVPDEFKDAAIKIKYATIDNFQDILDGKSNMVNLLKEAMIYEDLTPDVIELSKTLLSPDRLSDMPINLKTGGKYDSETFVKEKNQFLMDMKSGIVGKKQFAEGAVKFFGGDYEQMIEQLVESKNGSQEQVEPLKKLFLSMMQDQIEIKYRDVATDEIAERRLALDRAKFQYEVDQGNYFGNVNDGFNKPNPQINNGKPFDQAIAEANAITDPTRRKNSIKSVMATYFPGQTYQTDKDGRVYSFVPASNMLAAQNATPKDLSRGKIEGEYYDSKKKAWVPKTWDSVSDFVNAKAKLRINGMEVTSAQRTAWEEVVPGSVYTKPIGANVVKGYYDNAGKFVILKEDGSNLNDYLNSDKKSVAAQLIHKPFVRKEVAAGVENQMQQVTTELPGLIKDSYIDINSKEGQMIMNGLWGTQGTKAAETVGDGSSYSGYSGSVGF